MRYLGLDLGTKSLGIAISDTTHTIASPFDTIFFKEEDYESLIDPLQKIIEEYHISKIILGFPKNMNNTIGPRGEATISFQKIIQKHFPVEVILQDERLSTVEATNYLIEGNLSRKKRKKHVDRLSAVIILETYLNRERR